MKNLALTALALLFATASFADQEATITCTGENVVLTTRTPYWGENSPATQTLYILKGREVKAEETRTAYFLDVNAEGDVDQYAMIHTVGRNNQGGSFRLRTRFWSEADPGNTTVIHQVTSGLITYEHGTLRGVDEHVDCVKK